MPEPNAAACVRRFDSSSGMTLLLVGTLRNQLSQPRTHSSGTAQRSSRDLLSLAERLLKSERFRPEKGLYRRDIRQAGSDRPGESRDLVLDEIRELPRGLTARPGFCFPRLLRRCKPTRGQVACANCRMQGVRVVGQKRGEAGCRQSLERHMRYAETVPAFVPGGHRPQTSVA
jgi:hypothetical protein